MIYNMVCTCMHHIRLSQRRFSMAFSMSVAPGESTRADEIMWQLNVRMPVAWRWQWRSKAMGPMDVVMGAWLGDEHTQRGRERERESEHSLIICWWDVTWWASIDYQRDILMWTAGSVRDILLGCDLYPHDLAWILQDCGFGHHISHASTATKAAKQ